MPGVFYLSFLCCYSDFVGLVIGDKIAKLKTSNILENVTSA